MEQQRFLSFETICYLDELCVCCGQPKDEMRLYCKKEEEDKWNSIVSRKLRYFGHIMRKEDENLEKVWQEWQRYSWKRKTTKSLEPWSDDIKEWTHLSTERGTRCS